MQAPRRSNFIWRRGKSAPLLTVRLPLPSTGVRSGRNLRLEARSASLPTCAVQNRDPQRSQYVDSSRPRRKKSCDGAHWDKSTIGRGRQEPHHEPQGDPEFESVHSGWGRPRSQDFSCANDAVVDGRCAQIVLKNSEIERPRKSRFGAHRVISVDSPHSRAYGDVAGGKAGRSAEPLRNFALRPPALS